MYIQANTHVKEKDKFVIIVSLFDTAACLTKQVLCIDVSDGYIDSYNYKQLHYHFVNLFFVMIGS